MADTLFHSERNLVHKWALLSTIPCAIVIMMFASSIIMSSVLKPVLFTNDYMIAVPLYVLYGYGLLRSYKHHRKILPIIVFVLHLIMILLQLMYLKSGPVVYFAIITILITSVLNQYFRTGTTTCDGASCIN